MGDQNHNCSGLGVSIAFVSGAMLGAMAAILYAPHSGEETRRAIKGYARRTEEDVLEKPKKFARTFLTRWRRPNGISKKRRPRLPLR